MSERTAFDPLADALAAARLIASGDLTSEALVRTALDRIGQREEEIQAWVRIDPDLAIAEARQRDRSPSSGPLHGIPVGVKDVLDTADHPTQNGSPIYEGRRPASDAACVALLRRAGMVVIGKTVSTEFAMRHPGKTRNPHDPSRTPGGSSSGSAAAVGAGTIPLAIGTQTTGSVIRPASYCGAVGMKPTFAMIARGGLLMHSETLDTIGVLARAPLDALAFAEVLAGYPVSAAAPLDSPPTLGICRSRAWAAIEPDGEAAFEDAIERARAGGASLVDAELPSPFEDAAAAHGIVTAFETARLLAWEYDAHRDLVSPAAIEIIEKGAGLSRAEYREARTIVDGCRVAIGDLYEGVDALMTPAATGEAPVGHGWTGNASFNLVWTLSGGPCMTVPGLSGSNGMPIGTQIVGPWNGDVQTARVADWLAARLKDLP